MLGLVDTHNIVAAVAVNVICRHPGNHRKGPLHGLMSDELQRRSLVEYGNVGTEPGPIISSVISNRNIRQPVAVEITKRDWSESSRRDVYLRQQCD